MKKLLFLSVVLVSIVACKPKPEEPVIPGDPSSKPNWQAVINPEFPSSMTITCLPPEGETVTTEDEVAAFWGDTCRAVAGQANGIFYIVINGPQNTLAMDVKYYSATYKTVRTAKFTYTPEANVGSTDAPYRLDFTGAVAAPKRITLRGSMPGDDEASSPRRINIGQTVADSNKIYFYWREGDKIRLQEANGDSVAHLTLTNGANTRYGFFEFTDWATKLHTNVHVTYPTTAHYNNSNVTYTLPAEQTYQVDNFANDLMPAHSIVSINEQKTIYQFDFNPIASLLQLKLQLKSNTSNISVDSITITVPVMSSNQVFIAGEFTSAGVGTESGTVTISGGSSRSVKLKCTSAVPLSTSPTNFNIVLPSVTLPEGTTFRIIDTNNKKYDGSLNAAYGLGQGKCHVLPIISL